MSDLIYANGINAETGEPLLPPLPVEWAAALAQGRPVLKEDLDELRKRRLWLADQASDRGTVAGVNPNDLAQAGWGLIFAFEDQAQVSALREALSPLLELRRAQAGGLYRDETVNPRFFYRPGESKNAWLTRNGGAPGPVDPRKVPYYLLIVGDPAKIPYRFQYQLDVAHAVGRIHFDTLDEYGSYARSVVAAEQQAPLRPRQAAFFGVRNGPDLATQLSSTHLVEPLAAFAARRAGWQVQHWSQAAASKEQLTRLLGGDDTPAFLFAAGHGMGFDQTGHPRQRSEQGALVCSDWPGQGAPQSRHYLAADDIGDDARLQGLIAFFFACYGVGTPQFDEFALRTRQQELLDQGARLSGLEQFNPIEIAPQPFVAHLPQRLLGHPRGGALAVVGHVDRAWGFSFLWENGPQLAAFESALTKLLRGDRLGVVMEDFNNRYAELSSEIADRIEAIKFLQVVAPEELAQLWTANNDARNYVLLGDPAVKLAVAPAAGAARVLVQVESITVSAPAAASAFAAAMPAPEVNLKTLTTPSQENKKMSDHSTLPQRLSKVNGDQLVALLSRPSLEDDELLRAYFGPETYRRLRSLALRCQIIHREASSLRDERPRNHVVIVSGMLGSELRSIDDADQEEVVWLSGRNIASGALMRLRLAEDGLRQADPSYKIQVTGLLTRIYAELMLFLAQQYEVHTFSYDWRKSFSTAADELQVYLGRDFLATDVVHLVAHAEGGLVTRLHQSKYPEYWKTHQGKLLMLGTPCLGAISGVQALAGHLAITWWTDILDKQHSKTDLLAVVRSFPSVYELLPSPTSFPQWGALYEAQTYGPEVSSTLLARAKETRRLLDQKVECCPDRTICIAGVGRPTLENVDPDALQRASSKRKSDRMLSTEIEEVYGPIAFNGDGRVPALLADGRSLGITTYFTDAGQDGLLGCERVLQALSELLESPTSEDMEVLNALGLWANPIEALSANEQSGQQAHSSEQVTKRWDELRDQLDRSLRHIGSIEERELEDALLENLGPGSIMGQRAPVNIEGFPAPHIAIEVRYGDISALGAWASDAPPVDAIVVANQLGEEPQGALKALDQAISQALGQETLIAQLIQRNVIRSELAALFLLPDPRSGSEPSGRTIVIAGQGLPGRFGIPELKILSREVMWVLSRMGKKHIATVALGQGRSGLGTRLIMEAWIRGVKNAVTGFDDGSEPAMTLTFVEIEELKVLELDQAVAAVAKDLHARVVIHHTPLKDEELAELQQKAEEKSNAELSKKRSAWLSLRAALNTESPPPAIDQEERDLPPIRINIALHGSTYRIGALTATAALPERDITINPKTVLAVNDDLAASRKWQDQIEHGRLLAGLLLPEDLRGYLASDAPVILTLDSTTARIHWELLCPPLGGEDEGFRWSGAGKEPDFDQIRFLGMGRGLTRQLRTSYAPKPESLPSKRRLLRVLVIADPAADAPLPGAQEEGVAVADLFERVNLLDNPDNRVEVVRLIGPGEATPTAVLRELMNRSYDLLHFAGHCVYDDQDPLNSGWIFSGGQRMTANEIRRIDRVPSFVFSNACESGVTPDRSGMRSDLLAPTFAESFFARGVANFVCTAWPVNDRSARHYALSLYANLLGLKYEPSSGLARNLRTDQQAAPEPMYVAMREARRTIIEHDNRTWGAYQHYGNPNARLFAKSDRSR